jgi:hypothetical protein
MDARDADASRLSVMMREQVVAAMADDREAVLTLVALAVEQAVSAALRPVRGRLRVVGAAQVKDSPTGERRRART